MVARYHDGGASARPLLDTGSSFEPERANQDVIALPSAVRSATVDTAVQTNHNGRGLVAYLNVSAVPGVDTVTLSILAIDPVSGNAKTLGATAAISAVSLTLLALYPGLAGSSLNFALPRSFALRVQHAGAGAFTYSLAYSLIV